MVRLKLMVLVASALAASAAFADGVDATAARPASPSPVPLEWPVTVSLKTTLRSWAERQKWPAPQFLTEVDWPVDVPGSISGSIENALKVLAEGFGHAASRPRIEISANHVIVVSEIGAE